MKVEKLRVARPTADLEAVADFYGEGLGLVVRGTFRGHAGYDGLLLGTEDASYELEFTFNPASPSPPAPDGDHLLVFYLEDRRAVDAVAGRLAARGIRPVEPVNPYWAGRSLTFEDPDGQRVVLFDRSTLA